MKKISLYLTIVCFGLALLTACKNSNNDSPTSTPKDTISYTQSPTVKQDEEVISNDSSTIKTVVGSNDEEIAAKKELKSDEKKLEKDEKKKK